MTTADRPLRRIAPPARVVVHATDLGGVAVLKQGDLYLLTDPFGDVHRDSRGLGLYRSDTRILACSVLHVDGARPTLLRGDVDENFRSTIQLTNAEVRRDPSDKIATDRSLARQSLGFTRQRIVGAGLRERLTVANFTDHPELVTVDLSLGVDAADIFEVRGYARKSTGRPLPIVVGADRLAFGHIGLDGMLRRTQVAYTAAEVIAIDDLPEGRREPGAAVILRWRLEVGPGGETAVEWTVWADEHPLPADEVDDPPEITLDPGPPPIVDEADGAAAYVAWRAGMAKVESDNELFDRLIERSVADLRLLLNEGPQPGEHYLAAGVPWFATLFGRDAMISAYESIAFRPDLAVATLDVLAARQAVADDPRTDAEPGKILHEIRTGEMARTGELPYAQYYGSVDATPLWLILLGEAYDWTGDDGLVDRLWPNALAALAWIDDFGDLDGDGFVEYQRRSERGLINQGWKDSVDAVRDRTGRTAEGPIALAEVQAYVHDAKRRMARLARRRGEADLADRLEREADELKARFNAAFWVADRGFFAMALDGAKRPMDALASNVGQALWGGIVDKARARLVVEALAGPELDSGWGVRTYASGQPGYNPLGYHTGSIWPHDNALIVAGIKRYGFDVEASALAGRIFEAAQRFPDLRLPELYCGFDRTDVGVPVPYPVACAPQAWSAAAALLLVRTMIGARASAADRTLELVRPHLPTWLGKLTVTGLRVGEASVDLLFHRWRGTTSAEVLRKTGELEVTIRV
ncbi:MAG: amylo-alpha-1,6-glucosidase [Chloroflexota bacterium]|nr:amylo-alpha-1,6-glucosidase [Chloroflexota bacterium]